jgi:hypothetical protein
MSAPALVPSPAQRVLSIVPPMTQLNTPYPSTAYLTGFLRSRGVDAVEADLALELVLDLLSRDACEALPQKKRPHAAASFAAQYPRYAQIMAATLAFLQGRDPTLAHRIASRGFLREGPASNRWRCTSTWAAAIRWARPSVR